MRSISDLLNPCRSLPLYPNLSASACLTVAVKPVSPHWLKLNINTSLRSLYQLVCALLQQALPEYRQFFLAVWNRFCWKVVHFANRVCNMVWTVNWLYNSITCQMVYRTHPGNLSKSLILSVTSGASEDHLLFMEGRVHQLPLVFWKSSCRPTQTCANKYHRILDQWGVSMVMMG